MFLFLIIYYLIFNRRLINKLSMETFSEAKETENIITISANKRTFMNQPLMNYYDTINISKMSLPSKTFKKIGEKFLYFKKFEIGSGSFGKVLYGMNTERTKEVAVKFEKTTVKNSVFAEEVRILNDIKGHGVPQVYFQGKHDNYKVLVMDLLGPSLDKYFKITGKKFNLETTVYFGKEMIKRIQHVHSKGYLHRDIKPNNFMLGKMNRNSLLEDNNLYIIDFGLSKSYLDEETGKHYEYKEDRRFVGTPRYASLNTHLGIRQSRRDDLESIVYLLVYFLKGDLPWQGVKAKTKSEKKEKIKNIKQLVPPFQLCDDLPKEIFQLLDYVRTIKFEQEPDYDLMCQLLTKIQIDYNFSPDNFEWEWNVDFLNSKKYTSRDEVVYTHYKKKYEKLFSGYAYMEFEDYLNLLESKRINSTLDRSSFNYDSPDDNSGNK